MIEVTRLNGSTVTINAEVIELVESVPDTVITTITGRKLIVRDSITSVVERITAYRRSLGLNCPDLTGGRKTEPPEAGFEV